jgi:hypothetical protein
MSDIKRPTAVADRAGVSLLAYQMWKDAGCPDGQDQKFWFEAEARIRAAAKATPASPHPAASSAAAPSSTAPQKTPGPQFNPVFGQANPSVKSGQKLRRA